MIRRSDTIRAATRGSSLANCWFERRSTRVRHRCCVCDNQLLGRSQAVDSKDGEMSEWLKEPAWKTKPAAPSSAHRTAPTHSRSSTSGQLDLLRCAFVIDAVRRGFEGHLSQSYHNRPASLPRTHTDEHGLARRARAAQPCRTADRGARAADTVRATAFIRTALLGRDSVNLTSGIASTTQPDLPQ